MSTQRKLKPTAIGIVAAMSVLLLLFTTVLLRPCRAFAQEQASEKVACPGGASDGDDVSADKSEARDQAMSAASRDGQGGDSGTRDDNDNSAQASRADDGQAGANQQAAQAECNSGAGQSNDDDASGAQNDGGQTTEGRPDLQVNIDDYHDSQHYDTITIANDYFVRRDGVSLNMNDYAVFAHDQKGSERAVVTAAALSKDLSEQFAFEGGLGLAQSGGSTSPLGFVGLTANSDPFNFELKLSSDPVVSSAETIRSGVWQNVITASVNWDINDHLSAWVGMHRIYYSDANSSLETDFSPQYTIPLPGSQLILGYDLDYTSFARNPNAGYWAPQLSLANQGSVAWAFSRGDYFGRLQLASGPDVVQEAGQQNANSTGPSGGWENSALAAMGWRPTEDLTVQSYWTTDRSAQWNSTTTGISFNYLF